MKFWENFGRYLKVTRTTQKHQLANKNQRTLYLSPHPNKNQALVSPTRVVLLALAPFSRAF